MRLASPLIWALLLVALAVPTIARSDAAALRALADGEHRSPEHRARNQHRHPVETLEFFGLQPQMAAVELSPGAAGWYTEILAPYLRQSGRLYVAANERDARSEYAREGNRKLAEKLAARPDLYDRVVVTELGPSRQEIAPDGSVDMVLTFRNVHGWMAQGYADRVFAAAYRALRPGGVFGVVEHRAPADQPQDPQARSGYVREDHVIALARAAGFELDGRSEINANPRDSKDHPKGVWTLPPTLRLGETDRDKYLAIGESDRMTLRFVKPPAAARPTSPEEPAAGAGQPEEAR
jgi:predicted methyltransferase